MMVSAIAQAALTPALNQTAELLLAGLSDAEISKVLNIPCNTVRSRLRRMRILCGVDKRWSKRVKLAMILSGHPGPQ
jgi:DNA-binding NarL/FixJ family response regulator